MRTGCTCNVYASDGSGRVVAWRSWNCPVHRSDPPPKAAESTTPKPAAE